VRVRARSFRQGRVIALPRAVSRLGGSGGRNKALEGVWPPQDAWSGRECVSRRVKDACGAAFGGLAILDPARPAGAQPCSARATLALTARNASGVTEMLSIP